MPPIANGVKYPKWNKLWVYCHKGDGSWNFTPDKNKIPDGAYACEFVRNNDPFIAKVVITVNEEPAE